jgi:hypothetical protein
MPPVDAATALVQVVSDVLVPFAHDIGYPHQDAPKQGGGSASVIVIVIAIVATLALAGALFWVRERMRRAEQAEDPGS